MPEQFRPSRESGNSLFILHLEDNDVDAELIGERMRLDTIAHRIERVQSRPDYVAALARRASEYDLILADFALPGYDGLGALRVARELAYDVPFIFVSGNIGEEVAIQALKAGATDYVFKHNLKRLPVAIRRAMAERDERQDLRAAERARRASDERLQLALANAQIVGLWEWNLCDGQMRADHRFAALHGLAPARAENGSSVETSFAAVHGGDRSRLVAALEEAASDNGSVVAEYRVLHGATVRHALMRGRGRRDSAGRMVSLQGVSIDITEQREAEARLRIAQQAGHIGTIEFDDATQMATVSGEFSRLWGTPGGQSTIDGAALLALVHPDDRPSVEQAWRIGQTGAVPGATYLEHRIVSPESGAIRWVAQRGEYLGGTGGSSRFIGAVYDVSERKSLEEESRQLNAVLQQRLRDLEAAEEALHHSQKMQALGHLTGGIAHDFKNFLQSISGAVELAHRRQEEGRFDEIVRPLDVALRVIERADALVQRLLAFARRQTLAPSATDPNALVQGIAELIRRAVGPEIAVTLDPDPAAPMVLCDASQMDSALLNLALNARDAMPSGGTLSISTRQVRITAADLLPDEAASPGTFVKFTVADTGTGMAPDTLARAFEPFFTTKPPGQGTGLGLSQIYGFAGQSGGLVRLHSVPGQGTTASLYLPCCKQEQPITQAAA